MSRIIAVVGSGEAISDSLAQHAVEVGRLIAERCWVLATGGKAGVMEAASRGARQAGGRVIGILPERDRSGANIHVDIPIATGLGEARNAVIATCCDAMIAIGGEYGTLSEIAFALKLGKPVFTLDSAWSTLAGVTQTNDAGAIIEAIDAAIMRLSDMRESLRAVAHGLESMGLMNVHLLPSTARSYHIITRSMFVYRSVHERIEGSRSASCQRTPMRV